MNYFDIIFLLFLIWGGYRGYDKGFIVQSLTLVALILGIWASFKFSCYVTVFLISHFHMSGKLVPIVAFASIFVLVLVGVYFIGRILTSLVGETVLGTLNKIGGIVFGVIKMAFILSIVIFVIVKIDTQEAFLSQTNRKNSLLFSPIAKIAPIVFPYFHLEEIKNGLLKV